MTSQPSALFREVEWIVDSLQWIENPDGNGYLVEIGGNGANFVKSPWFGLDYGENQWLKIIRYPASLHKHNKNEAEAIKSKGTQEGMRN